MHWNTFARSAAFAAVAGIGALPWLVTVGPFLGTRLALVCYLVALAATYVAGVAPSRRRGLWAGAAVFVLGGCLALATRTLPELTIGLGVVVATVRGAFLYRLPPARAVTLEVVLIGGGLLFARYLAGPSLIAVMLAVWGFLLVQSFYFFVGGVRVRAPAAPQRDPFDIAHDRAGALLEGHEA